MGKEVAKYDQQWADQAKTYADRERTASGYITHRGGVFKAGSEKFPELCVVILADVYENSYYSGTFDSDNMVPPNCFAISEDEDDLSPHPAMQVDEKFFEPQSDECRGCPMNEFGSADTGRGKACKNVRRIAVLPAGAYSTKKGSRDLELDMFIDEDDEANAEHIANAPVMAIKIPPSSIKGYKEFVQDIASEHGRPPAGVITRIYTEPMDNGGHRLNFEAIELMPDASYPEIMARADKERPRLMEPYQPPSEEQTSGQKRGLKGLRKSN